MKNRTLQVVIILIAASYQISIFAQIRVPIRPYEKMSFHDFTPLWYETCFDSTLTDNVLVDGYNQFFNIYGLQPLINNDKIYSAYEGMASHGGGSYIQCRSLKTGQLLWQDRYVYQDLDRREIARLIRIDGNGHLDVFGFKRIHPKAQNEDSYFTDYILTRRIYNKDNGQLISYFHRDLNDAEAHQMVHDFTPWYYYSYMFYRDDHILIFDQPKRSDAIVYRSAKIDFTGKLMSPLDSMKVTFIAKFFNMTEIFKDTLLTIGYDYQNYELNFRYMTSDLKILEDFKYKTDGKDFFNFELLDISKDKSKILLSNQLNATGPIPWPYKELYVFDREAKVLKKATLPIRILDMQVLEWDNNEDYFIYSNHNNNVSPDDRFYKSLDVVKVTDTLNEVTLKLVATDSLRFPSISSYTEIDDDKLLLRLNEGSFYKPTNLYSQDKDANAQSMMLVSKSSLGITSGAFDVAKQTNFIKWYPNPTQDVINFESEKPISGQINVFDINGRSLLQKNIDSLELMSIDISGYLSGIYFVKLSDKEQSVTYRVVKI